MWLLVERCIDIFLRVEMSLVHFLDCTHMHSSMKNSSASSAMDMHRHRLSTPIGKESNSSHKPVISPLSHNLIQAEDVITEMVDQSESDEETVHLAGTLLT